MSVDVPLIEGRLGAELREMGFVDVDTQITTLDSAGKNFVITIVSDRFDGQTYLDREMFVRPVIARVLGSLGIARHSYVVEALTPAEDAVDEPEASADWMELDGDPSALAIERKNRRAWHDQREGLRRALKATGYELEGSKDGLFTVARKSLLAAESILIAFSVSTNAKTVDLTTRKALEKEWQARRHSCAYYVTPKLLEAPFANQSGAAWLTVVTATQFLHTLSGSASIAKNYVEEWERERQGLEREVQGPVIAPEIRRPEGESRTGDCFDYFDTWIQRPAASLLVLMASAGHGKTTIAGELAYRLAKQYLDTNGDTPIPLLVPFESVRRAVDFDGLVHRRLAELHGGAYGAFCELLKLNEAVLLVDGFDELADDAGIGVAEAQVRSMSPLARGKAKILLAGRSVFAQQFAGQETIRERVRSLVGDAEVDVLEILPFSPDQTAQYIETRSALSEAEKSELMRFAEATPDHEQLCSSPLFLRFLVTLAASGRLPSNAASDIGVDEIITQICLREEERQHLSLGVDRQLRYLGWAAQEMLRSTRPGLPAADLEVMAGMVAEEAKADQLVAARLTGHALLRRDGASTVSFVHPYIRDVILGRYARAEIVNASVARFPSLEIRDLPLATVQYLARHLDEYRTRLPSGWLSGGAQEIGGVARRNLFRVVMADPHRHPDEPSAWLDPRWALGGRLVGLDMSMLVIEGRNFSRLVFEQCVLDFVWLSECDFRGTVFRADTIGSASFVECLGDSGSSVADCSVAGVEVRYDGKATVASSSEELGMALRACSLGVELAENPHDEAKRKRAVAARANELLKQAMFLFVDTDPPKFYLRRAGELRVSVSDGREQLAIDRVILPGIVSVLCEKTLIAKSEEAVRIAKQWRTACVAFLRDGRMTDELRARAGRIVAKAGRYIQ